MEIPLDAIEKYFGVCLEALLGNINESELQTQDQEIFVNF